MEQGVVPLQGPAKITDDAPLRGQCLFETEQPSEQQHRAKTSQYAENTAPGHDASELTTENGCNDWCQAGHQQQPRKEDHQRSTRIKIARDCPGDHDPGRTGQTLYQAEQYEDCSAGRESTRHRSQEKGDQANDQWRSSAQPVRQRAGHELTNRESNQACSDRQLCQ